MDVTQPVTELTALWVDGAPGWLCSDADSCLLSCPQRRLAYREWRRASSEDEGDEEQ